MLLSLNSGLQGCRVAGFRMYIHTHSSPVLQPLPARLALISEVTASDSRVNTAVLPWFRNQDDVTTSLLVSRILITPNRDYAVDVQWFDSVETDG